MIPLYESSGNYQTPSALVLSKYNYISQKIPSSGFIIAKKNVKVKIVLSATRQNKSQLKFERLFESPSFHVQTTTSTEISCLHAARRASGHPT
jgi:hypothetical protein